MRKVALSVALVAAMLVTAVAFGQGQVNTYKLDAKVNGPAGSKARPAPVSVRFSYDVGEQGGNRPSPVKRYSISFYGVKANGSIIPKCTAATINASKSDSKCPSGSLVGSGTIQNKAGASNDITKTDIPCNLKLKVYNGGLGKAAIFIFGNPPECAISISQALPAKYVAKPGGGTALQFDVAPGLLHPIPGVDNAVVHVDSTIKKIVKKGKGYYSSVGCKSGKRPITVTFTPETGAPSTKSISGRC